MQIASDSNANRIESPPGYFVCLQGRILEYEISKVNRSTIENWVEKSKVTTYDTLGLYFIKPEIGKYFKILSDANGDHARFVDSGMIEQKKFGLNFKDRRSETEQTIKPLYVRDTGVQHNKMKLFELEDRSTTDTLKVKFFVLKDKYISSILTYMTVNTILKEKQIFRIEVSSKKEKYLYSITIRDLSALPKEQSRFFRKIVSQLK